MAIIQNSEMHTAKGKLTSRLIVAWLAVAVVVQFFPMLWMILGTFKTDLELTASVPTLLPQHWSLAAYKNAFAKYDLWNNFGNTVIIIGATMLIQITNSILSGYVLAAMRPRCGKIVLSFFLGTMMFSGTALMFPLYIQMTQMGLIGSKWSVILASSAWAYSIVLFKNFFESIPNDLLEAAEIDGASKIKTLLKIYLPLSKPILAVNIVNTAMVMYNDAVFPLMLLPESKDWTIMIRLFVLNSTGSGAKPSYMYAMLVAATVPILAIYMLAQKYITENAVSSGIKG